MRSIINDLKVWWVFLGILWIELSKHRAFRYAVWTLAIALSGVLAWLWLDWWSRGSYEPLVHWWRGFAWDWRRR